MVILSCVKFNEQESEQIARYGELYCFDHKSNLPSDVIKRAEILFGSPEPIIEDISGLYGSVKWIQLPSDGYDGIDIDLLSRKGIAVSYANGVYGIPIAEDIILRILVFSKESIFFIKNMQEKKWQKRFDLIELYNKNIIILGTGDIGKETAARAKAFGMKVMGYNRSGLGADDFAITTNERDILLSWLPECDFLVSTLPLTRETFHFIDAGLLGKASNKCLLVNVSRGEVIDEHALTEVLKNKKIKGAALDVFENEPLDEKNELWSLDNVYITPHISWGSDGWMKRLKDLFIYNLRYFPDYNKMKHIIRA
jgi:phosphoglycerate dehydrogenase-like enzyme